jgi:hypothetical protein
MRARVIEPFDAEADGEISLAEGAIVTILENCEDGWILVAADDGRQGFFPNTYLDMIPDTPNANRPLPDITDPNRALPPVADPNRALPPPPPTEDPAPQTQAQEAAKRVGSHTGASTTAKPASKSRTAGNRVFSKVAKGAAATAANTTAPLAATPTHTSSSNTSKPNVLIVPAAPPGEPAAAATAAAAAATKTTTPILSPTSAKSQNAPNTTATNLTVAVPPTQTTHSTADRPLSPRDVSGTPSTSAMNTTVLKPTVVRVHHCEDVMRVVEEKDLKDPIVLNPFKSIMATNDTPTRSVVENIGRKMLLADVSPFRLYIVDLKGMAQSQCNIQVTKRSA